MTIRKSVIITEFESDKFNPNDTILTMTPTESSRKGRMCQIRSSRRVTKTWTALCQVQDDVHKEVMQDIRQLYEGLDSTSGTRFPNPE